MNTIASPNVANRPDPALTFRVMFKASGERVFLRFRPVTLIEPAAVQLRLI